MRERETHGSKIAKDCASRKRRGGKSVLRATNRRWGRIVMREGIGQKVPFLSQNPGDRKLEKHAVAMKLSTKGGVNSPLRAERKGKNSDDLLVRRKNQGLINY